MILTDTNKKSMQFDLILLLTMIGLVLVGVLFNYSAEYPTVGDSSEGLMAYEKQLLFLIPAVLGFLFFYFFDYNKAVNIWYIFFALSIIFLIIVLFRPAKKGSSSWLLIGSFGIQPSEPAKVAFLLTYTKFLTTIDRHIRELNWFVLSLSVPLPFVGLILLQPDFGTAVLYFPMTLSMLYLAGAKGRYLLVIIASIVLSLTAVYPNYLVKDKAGIIINNKFEDVVKDSLAMKIIFSPSDIDELRQLSDPDVDENVRERVSNRNRIRMDRLPTKIRDEYRTKAEFIKFRFIRFTLFIAGFFLILFILNYLMQRKRNNTFFRISTTIFFIIFSGMILSSVIQYFIKPYQVKRLLQFLSIEQSYNVQMSINAIGSGGIDGRGYLQGFGTKLNYVPEKQTDFIYSVIGEQMGFWGSFVLILLYFIFFYRIIRILFLAPNKNGTLISAGALGLFGFQVIVNLGMSVGVMPVMGIPLPFISAGGSSLLTSVYMVALVLNIHSRRFVN